MSDNKRKLKSSGTTAEVSLDKSKVYKYDKAGALVEATVVGDNDITFSGSKSSLRRMADLERNVSILAATLTTADGGATDAADADFEGIFTAPARFKSTTRFDAAVDVRAAVAMNSNKITGLGTPAASGDASTKGYVDSAVSTESTARTTAIATAKAEAISTAASDATTKANSAQSNAASDATTKANAAQAAAATDATTKVAAETTARNTALALKSNLASPTFTGTPAAPTAAAGTNTTQVATTAFVAAVQAVAATDATTKANAAQAAAATDATTKANAAQAAAISAAATDATTKANAAQAAAISAAATDATTKANAAQAAAIAAVTNGAGAAFDTLKEIQDAMATDTELSSAIAAISNVPSATKLQTARTINGASFDGTANISFNTGAVSEGTNLYHTTARAREAISASGPVGYNNSTGLIYMAAATSTVNGYMTSTYAAKLDGIAAGATNVTNTNQLTNGAGYVTSSGVTSVATGNGLTGGTITSTGTLSLSGSYSGTWAVTGGITATGEITAYYSDVNLKKDIVEITDPIAKVMSLRGVTFRPNQTALDLGIIDKEEVGVIAQEVEAVLPQLVTPSAFAGFKTVKYDKLTALLLEAVKAQQLQIDALKAEISKLGGSATTEL